MQVDIAALGDDHLAALFGEELGGVEFGTLKTEGADKSAVGKRDADVLPR